MSTLYREAEFGDRQFVSTGASASEATASIRIVQYNVLAASQCTSASYCNERTGVASGDVAWSSRFPRLLSELKQYDADVIALEEVEREAFAHDFVPRLAALGYTDSMYANRDSEVAVRSFPAGRRADGVAVFCRTSVLKMIAVRRVLFSEEVERLLPEGKNSELHVRLDGSEHSGDSIQHEGEHVSWNTNGKGVALLALLKHEATNKLLVMAATHFYHDFRRAHVKTAQALMLTRAIDLFAKAETPFALPVVICGDFNSHPRGGHFWQYDETGQKKMVGPVPGGAYHLFQTGKLEHTHQDHPHEACSADIPVDLQSGLSPLVSAYSTIDGSEPEITARDAFFASCLDYIWLGTTLAAGPVHFPAATELLQMPYARGQGAEFPPIPNDKWPSDHIALGAVIAF